MTLKHGCLLLLSRCTLSWCVTSAPSRMLTASCAAANGRLIFNTHRSIGILPPRRRSPPFHPRFTPVSPQSRNSSHCLKVTLFRLSAGWSRTVNGRQQARVGRGDGEREGSRLPSAFSKTRRSVFQVILLPRNICCCLFCTFPFTSTFVI